MGIERGRTALLSHGGGVWGEGLTAGVHAHTHTHADRQTDTLAHQTFQCDSGDACRMHLCAGEMLCDASIVVQFIRAFHTSWLLHNTTGSTNMLSIVFEEKTKKRH